jgi:hypothetical protein
MRRTLMVALALVPLVAAQAQEPVVWVASPWQHVLKTTAAGTEQAITLVAARNEYEPCRVIVRAGVEPLREVNLTVTDLRGPGATIAAANLTLFREHYLDVFAPSYRSTAPTGWYPDALIPFVDPVTRQDIVGAKYDATPYTIEANVNQGYWIDVYVPKDANPGEYRGTVTVTTAGRQLATVPLTLTVRSWALPDTIALQSCFGSLGNRLAKQNNVTPGSPELAAIEDEYIDVFLAHRAVPGSLGNIWPTVNEDGTVDDSQTGERLRRMVEDKHVNALRLPFSWGSGPEKCKVQLRALAGYLRGKGWLDLAYVYMKDEPNKAEEYEIVRQQGAVIKEADPGIKRMCTEQTVTSNAEWGTLYGAVDIWCPLWGLYDEKTAEERKAAGERLWSYTALCQGKNPPFWQVDFAPTAFRAPFWTSWRYDIKGFLYWSSVYWDAYEDVWTKPHFRDKYWGEGMLVYPGPPAGIKGPVTSIRLKLVREALEDYEYMTLAAKQGHRLKVDAIVMGLTRSFEDWEQDPAAYMRAREELAGLVH